MRNIFRVSKWVYKHIELISNNKALLRNDDSVINEFNLWEYIICYKITNKSENDAFQQSFNLLKKEIRNQVKNDNIQDEQLRIFVNYIKQL